MLRLVVLALCVARAEAALLSSQLSFFRDICASTNVGLFPFQDSWCRPGTDPCTWTGVQCDSLDQSVVERLAIVLNLPFPLTGTLPESISAFSSLVEFRLYCANGYLKGTLGQDFFVQNSDTLQILSVLECPILDGQLPDVSGFPVATNITIFGTSIGDRISTAFLGESPNLVELVVSASDIVGPLPDAFLNMSELRVLDLSGNKLTGSVPESLCGLPRLQELFLNQNYLDQFPECLGETMDPRVLCDLRDNFYCTNYPDPSTLAPCVVGPKDGFMLPSPDACGVCGGNGTSCLDCDGIPNGSATINECGFCAEPFLFDISTCPDCAGTPGGELKYDACGVCGGDNSTCTDCAGVLNGSSRKDICHVCNGDGTTCTDCYGQLYGTARLDLCGVCNGDNSTCDDCNGVPNGGAAFDVCGVCGGAGVLCRDCSGAVNGTLVYDACDVCGGDGTSCGIEFIRRQTGSESSAVSTILFILLGICIFALCPLFVCQLWVRERQLR